MEATRQIHIIDLDTEEGRAAERSHAQELATRGTRRGAQQLYARIKKSSKYFGQTKPGVLFPVFLDARIRDDYKVQGGPGGQYRLADVNLFVVSEGGDELRIS